MRAGRGEHRPMTRTNAHSSEVAPHMVAAMYAPAAFVAAGWLLGLIGWGSDSLGIGALGFMLVLCGLVMAPPMAVIALYRASNVGGRPVIWGAAVLDAAVLAATGVFLLAASG
jgi:hypothetical protein